MYTCVLLKNPNTLLNHLVTRGYLQEVLLNDDWEIICHHMTINMGDVSKGPGNLLDKDIELTCTHFAFDDKVCAVKCSGYPTTNSIPHITIAVNRKNGGKPFLSNKLINWDPMENVVVHGDVTELQ